MEDLLQTSHEVATHPVRQWAGRAGLMLAGAAAGAALGAGLSLDRPTHFEIGPHEATAQLAHGKNATIDLGLLGSGDGEANTTILGQHLTAQIHVDGINPALEGANDSLSGEVLTQYSALVLQPDATKQQMSDVKDAFVTHTEDDALTGGLWGAGIAGMSLLGAAGGARWLKKRYVPRPTETSTDGPAETNSTRSAIQSTTLRRTALAAAGLAVVGSGLVTEYVAMPTNPSGVVRADSALNGLPKPLDGIELHGLVKAAVDNTVPAIEKYVDQSTDFYNNSALNMGEAFAAQAVLNLKDVPQGPQYKEIALVTDQHCNTGMSKVIEAAVQDSGAEVLLDAGDSDFSGTFNFEDLCTSGLAEDLLKQHVTLAGVDGNHDSTNLTQTAMQKQGWIMIGDGKLHMIDGIPMMGANDTRRSALGSGITGSIDDEYKLGHALADEACDSTKPVGIVVVHEPQAGFEAAMRACSSLVLTGHTHQEMGPVQIPTDSGKPAAFFYTGGTAGGAVSDGLEKGDLTLIGPLHDNAVFAIFVWDSAANKPMGHYTIAVHTDESVSIGKYTPISASPTLRLSLPDATTSSIQTTAPSPAG